ncbi:unnamed protein product [Prunus armeniaca]
MHVGVVWSRSEGPRKLTFGHIRLSCGYEGRDSTRPRLQAFRGYIHKRNRGVAGSNKTKAGPCRDQRWENEE